MSSTTTVTATTTTGPSSTTSTLIFAVPPTDGARPFVRINEDPTGERAMNITPEPSSVIIENLRGKEGKDAPTLDTTGFQLFHRPAKHTSFASDKEVEREYYPESIELLKELTGASRVVLFDHSMLHSSWSHLLHRCLTFNPHNQLSVAVALGLQILRHRPANPSHKHT
jgi:hypothetical protein